MDNENDKSDAQSHRQPSDEQQAAGVAAVDEAPPHVVVTEISEEQLLPSVAPAVPVPQKKKKSGKKKQKHNSLLDVLGLPVARESGLLTEPTTCALYTLILVLLCIVNAYYLGRPNDFILYEWYQNVRLLYQISVSNFQQNSQLFLCAATSGFLLSRWFGLSMTYCRQRSVWIALAPFFLLAFVPFFELLNYTINVNVDCLSSVGSLFSGEGRISLSSIEKLRKSVEPAFALCFAAGLGIFIKMAFNPAKGIKVFEDGILVFVKRATAILGERPIFWQEIERVEVAQAERPTEGKGAEKVIFHLRTGDSLTLTWKELTDAADPTDLFAALKTAVPNAIPDGLLGTERGADQGDSYTELWLKYFTTGTKRERLGKLEQGTTLCNGKYVIAGEIGAGGQGTAYLATPTNSTDAKQDHVVLKEYIMPLHRGEALFQQSMKKLEQETQILLRINHPQIVKMTEHFVEDHRGYLVLEYVDGKPLKDLVQLEGPQNQAVVINIALQVCDILSYLHGLEPQVVHRDLTPDNLIMQEDGLVKLVDFNVAQQLESAATATVVGKHAFIPPEQFRGKPSAQSDIYAFGGTLHHLLTGKDPEPLSASRPRNLIETVSEELDRIIAKATALDCAKRYANVDLMKTDLLALHKSLES